MSFRTSIFRWSNAPACTAVPVQHTFPPYDGTGFIGSYVNESGLSAAGADVVSRPSPVKEFARPALDKYIVIGCAPVGGHVSDVCHLFIPIVKYVTFGIASIFALFSPFRNRSKKLYVTS